METAQTEDMVKISVAYCRISSEDQSRFSIESQVELCIEKAKALGYTLPKENIFIDNGVSARTLNRPALTALLNFCQKKTNNVQALITYKIDRISRETADFLAVRKILSANAVKFISCSEQTGETPSDQFVELIMAGVATLDNQMRTERVKKGVIQRIKAGLPPSVAPIGYRNITLPNGHHSIDKDPIKYPIIQRAWLMMATGTHTLKTVSNYLNTQGISSKRGLKTYPLIPQQVSRIFNNRTYCGYAVSRKNNMEVKSDIIPQMIDDDLFYKVQGILQGRTKNKALYQKLRPEFPLRGYLTCVDCNQPMYAGFSKGRNKYYGYFFCRTHPTPCLKSDDVDNAIMALFAKMTPQPLFRKMFLSDIHTKWSSKYIEHEKNQDLIEKQINDIKEMQYTIAEKNAKGVYSDEFTMDAIKRMDNELLALKISKSEEKLNNLDIEVNLAFMEGFLENIGKAFIECKSLERKRMLVGSLFPKGLVYRNNNLEPIEVSHTFKLINQYTQKDSSLKYNTCAGERT